MVEKIVLEIAELSMFEFKLEEYPSLGRSQNSPKNKQEIIDVRNQLSNNIQPLKSVIIKPS